jgi:hypothetical protein
MRIYYACKWKAFENMAHAQVFSDWFYRTGKIRTENADRKNTASEVPDRFKTRLII